MTTKAMPLLMNADIFTLYGDLTRQERDANHP